MDVGIIIGEATPLDWDRWRHLCRLIDGLGFNSLFRSDHYFNGQQKDALDVYLSFVLAAEETDSVRFGPLVTPITFREPVNVGRMAQQLDALSGGRFVLGLGAGWHAEEHRVYGVGFPPRPERYDRLNEAIELMNQLWYATPGHFNGEFYQLDGTDSKPHPPPGRPPILIGGTGPRRTLPIVAKYGHEWNATPLTPDAYHTANQTLAEHCATIGRDPADIRRSILLFTTIGPDQAHEQEALKRYLTMISPEGAPISLAEATAAGNEPWHGSLEQLVEYIGQLGELGVDEIVFDHLCHDNDEFLHWLMSEVVPRLA